MQEIQFIAPAALHDEMLRLRNEKQMDFLESLTGMDWGVADEKDTPEKLRGLGVVYHLESTITGERIALKTATTNRELPEIPSVSDIWKIADFYEREVFDFYGITFVGYPFPDHYLCALDNLSNRYADKVGACQDDLRR